MLTQDFAEPSGHSMNDVAPCTDPGEDRKEENQIVRYMRYIH